MVWRWTASSFASARREDAWPLASRSSACKRERFFGSASVLRCVCKVRALSAIEGSGLFMASQPFPLLATCQGETVLGLIRWGKPAARQVTRARILLKADEGLNDEEIAEEVATSRVTVERTRQRFVE